MPEDVVPGWNQQTVAIDVVHNRVHQGFMWSFSHFEASVADAASLDILIAPGTKALHTLFRASGGGDALAILYENPTVSAAGNPVTVSNRNRFTPGAAEATITEGPTVTGVGDLVDQVFLPGGTGFLTGGGTSGFDNEFILDPTNTYLFRLTNLSGVANPLNGRALFYEITKRQT